MRATASSAARWSGSRCEHLLVRLLRRGHVAETPLLHVAEPHEEGQLRVHVAAIARGVELALEQLGELGVASRLLVELREREDRLGVRRILVEHAAERLDGLLGRREAVPLELRELEAERGAFGLRGGDVDQAGKQPREILVTTRRRVELAQGRRGAARPSGSASRISS